MEEKNKIIFGIVLVFVIIVLIFKPFLFISFNRDISTEYDSVSYAGEKIIYSNINSYSASQTGFTNIHRISEPLNNYFEFGVDNKGLYALYLESNGIDSSQFSLGGYKTSCVFSPSNVNQNNILYKTELESLGFTYMASEEGTWSSSGDAGICNFNGCCTECKTIGCSGAVNRACSDGGHFKYTVTGYNACWAGNYQPQKLNIIATKLVCNAKGKVNYLCHGAPIGSDDRCNVYNYDYNVQGVVSYDAGFICNVDKEELFNQLPKTIVRQDGKTVSVGIIGIIGTVEFKLAEQKTFYRLTNNACTQISILENQKTSNDYLTLLECQSNILCKTSSDINCDGIISRTELGVSITKFLTGAISRSELGEIIQAWAIS